MKFLFWQFAFYAIAAFALGFVAAWSWFSERLRSVQTVLERTRVRITDAQDARHQLHEARAAAATATESLAVLRERFTDSETVRSAVEVEVESLRSGRLKLLSELSELRSSLDSASVSRARLTAAEHEATRLRGLLDDADLQLRTERVAREQTLSVMKSRLADVEKELATLRLAPSVAHVVNSVRNRDAGIRPVVTDHPSHTNQTDQTNHANQATDTDRLSTDLVATSRSATNRSNETAGLNAPFESTVSAADQSDESDDPEVGSFPTTARPGDYASLSVKSSKVFSPPVTLYSEGPAQIVDLRADSSLPVSGE